MRNIVQIQQSLELFLSTPDEELEESQKQELTEYTGLLEHYVKEDIDDFSQFLILTGKKADALTEEGHRLLEKARILKKRVDSFKSFMLATLAKNGLNRCEGAKYTVSIRNSKKVEIDPDIEPEDLSINYVRITREFDKRAIRAAIENGEAIDGCRIIESPSLRIS